MSSSEPAAPATKANPGLKPHEKANSRRFVVSNALVNVGDQFVAAKTVLPWVFTSAGVPAFFLGLLVPIRESGSMLPQAALTPWITSKSKRAPLWIAGAFGQAAAALAIGLSALFLRGWPLGIAVAVFLAVLAFFRAICSITSKDIQGRTMSKGRRGRVTGTATLFGGLVALTVGAALKLRGQELSYGALVGLVMVGAAAWFVSAFVFMRIEEPEYEITEKPQQNKWWSRTVGLLRRDKQLRKFVTVRSLMLVSALSPAFIVALAQESKDVNIGLGPFLMASGIAAVIGGRISGLLSDRSSRKTMSYAAAITSVLVVATVAGVRWAPQNYAAWIIPLSYFLVSLTHVAIRVARKTYVVDMAEGDQRTEYVAVANTAMGIILLVLGGISSLVALLGSQAALLFLALVGCVGAVRAMALPEVSGTVKS